MLVWRTALQANSPRDVFIKSARKIPNYFLETDRWRSLPLGQYLIDRSKHPLIPGQVTSPAEAASLYNDD